jgi:phage-related protein
MARALAEAFVRVRADTSSVRKDIEKGFGDAGSRSGRSFSDAFDKDTNKRLGSSFKRVGSLLSTSLGAGGAALGKLAGFTRTATIALTGLAAAVASLNTVVSAATAFAPLAGGLLLIPAVALSAATALGTLKLATSGMSDAFKLAMTPGTDPKKLAESMKYLSPAARAVTLELNKLRPTLLGIRNTAQQALFAPLIGQMTALAKVLGGPIRTGAAAVAAQFGAAGRQVAEFARQSKSIELVKAAFGQTQLSVSILRTALDPLLKGFRALATEGLSFLPRIATAVSSIATRFGEWLQKIVASGQATKWIDNFFKTLAQLGGVLKSVGGIMSSIFSAASASGSGFLGVIGQALAQLNAFLKTAAGKSALTSIFQGLGAIGASLAPVIGALVTGLGTLAKPLGQLAQLIGPILTTAITALAPALAAIAPGLKALFGGLGQAIELVAPALLPLGKAIGQIGVAIGPILPVVGTLVGQLVSGLAPILGQLFIALGPLVLALVQLAGSFTPLIAPLGQIILQLVQGLVPALIPIIGIMGQVAGTIGQFLVTAIQTLVTAIVPLLPQLTQMAQTIGVQLMTVLIQLAPALLELLVALVPLLPSLVNLLPPLIQLVVVLTPVLVLIIRLASAILSKLLPPLVSLIGLALSLYSAFSSGAVKGLGLVINAIAKVPSAVTGAFSKAGSWLYNAGKSIINGLINGISAAVGKLRSLLSKVTSWIPSWKGPMSVDLRLLQPSGAAIMTGLVGGIRAQVPMLRRTLAGVTGQIVGFSGAGLDATAAGVSRTATRLAGAAVPAVGNNGLAGATAGSAGGAAGLDVGGLADAVAAGIHRANIGVDMDGDRVGQVVSKRLGRATDQRRRTG